MKRKNLAADVTTQIWLKLAWQPALWKYFYRQQQVTAHFLAKANCRQIQESLQVDKATASQIKQQLKLKVKEVIEKLKEKNVTFISRESTYFPAGLKQLAQVPLGLFVQGNWEIFKKPIVAIVGARKCTAYGRQIAFEFSQALAAAGLAVISGLAIGIDTQAHLGALEKGTIAVLGSGFNHLYPAGNKNLAAQILKNKGLLLTEYPLDWPVKAVHFPARNRLIAALADVVIVVEAAKRSGALITADFGLELGKEVMAVPGSIKNPYAVGCHNLIKQGAFPVTDVSEVLSLFNLPAENSKNALVTQNELFYLNMIDYQGLPVDLVIAKAKKAPKEVLSFLTTLELKGYIKKEGGKVIRVR